MIEKSFHGFDFPALHKIAPRLGEIDGLEKLHRWSGHLPDKIGTEMRGYIKKYLTLVTHDGWKHNKKGEKDIRIEDVIMGLDMSVYKMFNETPGLASTSFSLLTKILDYRSSRIEYSGQHIPPLLKQTLHFSALLLIGLSMFVAIKDVWMALLFTASIACLIFSIFLVLKDLDNPMESGDWQVTTKDYEDLLEKIISH